MKQSVKLLLFIAGTIAQSYLITSNLMDISNYPDTFLFLPLITPYIQNVLNSSCSNYSDSMQILYMFVEQVTSS